jgi:parallel beta-helix repeat protein
VPERTVALVGAGTGAHARARDPDLGRAEVTGGKAAERAFKVPTLRNVALTAPYMHNGVLATLEDVIDFYGKGGGRGLGLDVPNIDDKIRPFSLTAEERADLIAFLHALTDESALPAFPERVPSGLPVVPRLENPARARAAALNVGSPDEAPADGPPQVVVRRGESIQAAVLRSRPGATIEVEPGTYHETVTVDVDGITLRGLPGPDLDRPVLDGRGLLADAVIATGSRFTIENLDVRRYTANGVQAQNARDVVMRDLFVDTTGLYGVYPVSCTGVLVERVKVTGVADAGIYVGQSRDIVVRDCEAYGNVTGIEIENSVGAVVERNHVHGNAGGILVFLLPNNPSKVARGCRLAGNRVIANNGENFADKAAIVAGVPRGTGILIMAADETEVTSNIIQGNDSCGIALLALDTFFPKGSTFDVGPVPERNRIHGNAFADNGRRPADAIVKAGLPGADILWDLSGWSNTFDEPGATRGTPLIASTVPAPVRLGAWRLLGFARSALGNQGNDSGN